MVLKHLSISNANSNDNALVECKNGAVIRRHIGRNHISKSHANPIDSFYENYFNPFLNYHRICAFATDYVDKKGKIRKKYETYLTPYEEFKSLGNPEQYLEKGFTFANSLC